MQRTISVEAIVDLVITSLGDEAIRFIDERADKLARASFSSGQYGRIMLPLLKKCWPRLNWDGQSTRIALALTAELEERGYGFIYQQGSPVRFMKKAEA